jgi:hypothetical protein
MVGSTPGRAPKATGVLRRKVDIEAVVRVLGGLGHDLSNVLLPLRARALVMEAGPAGTGIEGGRGEAEGGGEAAKGLRGVASKVQRAVDALQALCAESGVQDVELGRWWARAGAAVEKAVPRGVSLSADVHEVPLTVRADAGELTWRVLSLVYAAGNEIVGSKLAGTKEVKIRARAVGAGDEVRLEIWPECQGVRAGKLRALRFEAPAGGPMRSARCVVSLGAGRSAALVRFALLSTLGAGSTAVDAAEPGDAQVWVVGGSEPVPESARAWRERVPGALLVVAGGPADGAIGRWQELGAAMLSREDDLEGLRRRVREWMHGGVAGGTQAGAQRA